MTLTIPERIRDGIVAHAREGAPEEVCGVLAGVRGDDSGVQARHPAENAADAPRTRYAIAPREQLELLEAIDDAGREAVGFYHSHPRGPPEPSDIDAAEATWPARSYVIVSLGSGDPRIGSWRWSGERFVAEEVRVVEGSAAGDA